MNLGTQKPTRAQRVRWPLIVTGLLSCHVGAMVLAVNIASVGDGNAILPDYYEKALRWDERRALSQESEGLGWELGLSPAVTLDAAGQRAVRGVLVDAAGVPLVGAEVRLRTWNHESGDPLEGGPVATSKDGSFTVSLPMAQTGAWRCESMVKLGGDHFVDSRELHVAAVDLAVKGGAR